QAEGKGAGTTGQVRAAPPAQRRLPRGTRLGGRAPDAAYGTQGRPCPAHAAGPAGLPRTGLRLDARAPPSPGLASAPRRARARGGKIGRRTKMRARPAPSPSPRPDSRRTCRGRTWGPGPAGPALGPWGAQIPRRPRHLRDEETRGSGPPAGGTGDSEVPLRPHLPRAPRCPL
ncbi:unnamed protein product, partial [Rangifer tarandus platyrhynchus]